ncbi:unnamed protein product [Pseudo-nitzschia multistriata]|uniref:Uncharacterized protein n=1 Tax=Pseudo-nitzschia multistriata TaxID=183589 RepID=A0A448YXE1_9STRA|nr:unnamed protein product [Pseudo-nitzschia multistriata]
MRKQLQTNRNKRRRISLFCLGTAVWVTALVSLTFLQVFILRHNEKLGRERQDGNASLSSESFYQITEQRIQNENQKITQGQHENKINKTGKKPQQLQKKQSIIDGGEQDKLFSMEKKTKMSKMRKGQLSWSGGHGTPESCSDTKMRKIQYQLEQNARFRKKNMAKYVMDFRKRQSTYIAQSTTSAAGEWEETMGVHARGMQLFVDLDSDQKSFVANSSDNESASENDGPWFVLHIGPPKTATTTVQCGLEKHSLRLAKTDGYHFLGGGCGMQTKEYFMPNGEQVTLRLQILVALHSAESRSDYEAKRCHEPVSRYVEAIEAEKHRQRFIDRASFLRSKNRSVILSSEQFGSQLSVQREIMEQTRSMILSTEDGHGAGFPPDKVRIVLAYRHFVDWLPSFYYQKFFRLNSVMDREWHDNFRVRPLLEYIDEYLTKWEAHQRKVDKYVARKNATLIHEGHSPLSLLPTNRQSIHPSWWLYTVWSAYFPLPNQVQVYDMHSPMNMNRPEDDMVTDFICHMLPSANDTCQNMMDEADGKYDKSDYDNLDLHSFHSLLHPNRTTDFLNNIGRGNKPGAKRNLKADSNGDNSNSDEKNNGKQTMVVRPSSDHHAKRIVEELLGRGDIKPFPYEEYGTKYFEKLNEGGIMQDPSDAVTVNGYTMPNLLERANEILENHGVYSQTPKVNSTFEERFSEKYFDCITPDLEERLLNASRTFMDLMYKHTPMLSQATAATYSASNRLHHSGSNEDRNQKLAEEREKRWIQAKAEHERLFAQNKQKGKYCEINPDKVFHNRPEVRDELKSLRYKPAYNNFFLWKNLPERQRRAALSLGFGQNTWERKLKIKTFSVRWDALSSDKQAAAFQLGYNKVMWDGIVLK